MSIESVQDAIKDYARDTRVNLGNILTVEPQGELSQEQIYLVALACAYATESADTVRALEEITKPGLSEMAVQGAKEAASIMAMNNVYYRTMHMFSDEELQQGPARLRMTVIGKPSVSKLDFELACLAVSAIAGCKGCVVSHADAAMKAGLSKDGVRNIIRIAAVINSVSRALFIS